MEEAHRRDIEVHAWLNPYNGASRNSSVGLAPDHICMKQSEYCYPYGTHLWMDPGAPEIVDQLILVIEDLVTRY